MATVALSSYSVGDSVYLKESNSNVEYIVVHKGIPSSNYDSSCNGVWLMRKTIYTNRAWGSSSSNNYGASSIHTWLNSTFIGLFSSAVQGLIKTAKIPYSTGGSSLPVSTGSDGLEARVFLLSSPEVGFKGYYTTHAKDGDKLDYFTLGTTDEAKALRVGLYNSAASFWYLRSPHSSSTSTVALVHTTGAASSVSCTGSYGIRPAVIFPANAAVTDNVITGQTIPSATYIGVNNVARTVSNAYIGALKSNEITLTNMSQGISGTTGFTSTTSSFGSNTTYVKDSTSSFYMYATTSNAEVTATTSYNMAITSNHKYYIRLNVYFRSATKCRTTLYWPVAEPYVWNSSANGISISADTWKTISKVTNRTGDGHSAGSYPLRIDFDCDYSSGYMYADGLMVIDLTAAFGSGNEPDAAWCDANIPYFTGSRKVSYNVESYVARKIISGHIGVDGVARQFYAG